MINKNEILMTSALPYGNGDPHLGHCFEFILADIMARFYRMSRKKIIYVCATDAHGTPIELKAKQNNMSPEEFVKINHEKFKKALKFLESSVDNYYITHSKENEEFAIMMFKKAMEKGYIYTKHIELLYCEKCGRFLPDRYVKGKCPKCGAENQYGDVCEVCGSTHNPQELINPKCAICGSKPITKKSKHYFFKLSAFSTKLKEWINNSKFQEEVKNYLMDWINKGLEDWCISRDGPYFGFKIPGEKNKYFYVWWDAPIGYLASTMNYCKKTGEDWKKYWMTDETAIIHVIGKDIIYFHYLFWPAMLMACEFSLPDYIHTHGFITVGGSKMSKSRGTFVELKDYQKDLKDPEYLRFYFAYHLSNKVIDVEISKDTFINTINHILIGNFVNLSYRTLSFTYKFLGGYVKSEIIGKYLEKSKELLEKGKANYEIWNIKEAVENALKIASLGNTLFQKEEPWKKIKDVEKKQDVEKIMTTLLNIIKMSSVLLKPIIPSVISKIEDSMNKKFDFENAKIFEKEYKIKKPKILMKKIDNISIF